MGIEDLDINSLQHADRVLIFSADEKLINELENLLAKRQYTFHTLSSFEKLSQHDEIDFIDLVVLECDSFNDKSKDFYDSIKNSPKLRRSSLLILTSNIDKIKKEFNTDDQQVYLPLPLNKADFLVKVTTNLRLRKIQKDQFSHDAKIAQQNAELRDLTNRFKHELQEARTIQQSILPKKLPEAEKYLFGASYVPLEAVGGDLYDIWKISEDKIGFFIADVTGHGLPAAFIGAMTKMALSYADQSSPEKMLYQMNNGIAPHMPQSRFVTAAAAILCLKTNSLSIARAGHPAPILFRERSKDVEIFEPKGLPLGIVEDCAYEKIETNIEPGDTFLLYTDGIIESSAMNGEMFGMNGLITSFKKNSQKASMNECFRSLLEDRELFTEGRIIKDDDTFLGFKSL